MAYMNQEKKATIKAALDKILKPLGLRYSLRVRHHSAIVCTISAGPIDFIGNWQQCQRSPTLDHFERSPTLDHLDVNHYWIKENFSGEARDVLLLVKAAMQSAAWYDRSDAQVDYFDTAYYYNIQIGTWEKPYKFTGSKTEELEKFISEHFEFVHVGG